MEKRILAYAFCLLLLVAGIILWVSRESVQEVQSSLEHAQAHLETVSDELQEAQTQMNARKEAAALIAEAAALDQQNRKLRAEIQDLHRQKSELTRPRPPMAALPRYAPSLAAVPAAKGIPEIILATGTTLTQVTVESMNAETAVLRHSEGVSQVPLSILPASLVEKLKAEQKAASPASSPAGSTPAAKQ